jgi:hypothetical protein
MEFSFRRTVKNNENLYIALSYLEESEFFKATTQQKSSTVMRTQCTRFEFRPWLLSPFMKVPRLFFEVGHRYFKQMEVDAFECKRQTR